MSSSVLFSSGAMMSGGGGGGGEHPDQMLERGLRLIERAFLQKAEGFEGEVSHLRQKSFEQQSRIAELEREFHHCQQELRLQVDANQQLQRQVTSLQQERSALVQQVEGQQREIQKLAGLKEHILRSLGAEDPMPTHHWAGAGDSVLRPSFPQRSSSPFTGTSWGLSDPSVASTSRSASPSLRPSTPHTLQEQPLPPPPPPQKQEQEKQEQQWTAPAPRPPSPSTSTSTSSGAGFVASDFLGSRRRAPTPPLQAPPAGAGPQSRLFSFTTTNTTTSSSSNNNSTSNHSIGNSHLTSSVANEVVAAINRSVQRTPAASSHNQSPPPAVDADAMGREFFHRARNSLSEEGYKAFLGEIKLLNQQQKSKEQVLDSCRGILAPQFPDLWSQFQQLMNLCAM